MIFNKILALAKCLEDPEHPLLGPNLRGLYLFGLWQKDDKIRNFLYNIFHMLSFVFVLTQIYALYLTRNDFMQVLLNFSMTAVSGISILKTMRIVFYQTLWNEMFYKISKEETSALNKGDIKIINLMKRYTIYSRIVTYLYWPTVGLTSVVVLISPFIKYAMEPTYRELILNGTEPLPQILFSWFPFDNSKMPGYTFGLFGHALFTIQGAGVVAVFDMNAVSIMTFLKGQMIILRYKCETIFGDRELNSFEVIDNIKECFRLHSFLTELYNILNSLLSPVMFLYVLICSIMICCSVVQLSLGELGIYQKILVLEYTLALVIQLFIYCWHSNEIAVYSNSIDSGIYSSDWWLGNVKIRRQLLLLAGKMSKPFIFNAGPFTTLSVQTFVDIMKGSYSFYTLFSHVDDLNK